MFFYQYNGGPIPEKLRGISIRSVMIDGVLVQQVQGWLDLAKAILPEKMQGKYRNSLGSELMCQMNTGGSIHDRSSDAFGDIATHVLKRIYNSNTSIIAVRDHRLPNESYLTRTTILALRTVGNCAHQVAYEKIYKPGLFVNGGTEKLSLTEAHKIVKGSYKRFNAFCIGLRDEFKAQATDNRVEARFVTRSNPDGYLVSYGLLSP